MGMIFLEIAIFALNIWNAIANRGTIWGWLSVLFIFWQVYMTIKVIREI
jgi:D-alanyl-lipoteichoic acid acyltransferase DltB (MBOAT superfamily)